MAIVKIFSNDINNIKRETSCLKKTIGSGESQGEREPNLCPYCKKEGYHEPDACFEIAKNKDKRPPGWKSWEPVSRLASKDKLSKSTIDKLLTHTDNFIPTLYI